MSSSALYLDPAFETQELDQISAASKSKDAAQVQILVGRRADRLKAAEAQRALDETDDIAALTINRLRSKAEDYFQQMLCWKPLLEVQRVDSVRIFESRPEKGYASIIYSYTPNNEGVLYPWIFYFCNFRARFGTDDSFFQNIPMQSGVTFFGLAVTLDAEGKFAGRDTSVRGNGLLFATPDPAEAFENVSRLCDMRKLWNAISKMPLDQGSFPG